MAEGLLEAARVLELEHVRDPRRRALLAQAQGALPWARSGWQARAQVLVRDVSVWAQGRRASLATPAPSRLGEAAGP